MAEKILLADDERGIRKVLGIALMDSGYDVVFAENGEEALRVFREERPAIVLTDIKMPGIDGVELLRLIKEESPDTEVIMISGHGDMDLAIESLKLDATDFITKPINDDTLEIALKRAREKIAMRRQLREYTENLEAMVEEKSARLVEVERQMAVGQAVEGLSSALSGIAGDLEDGITYFNEMPCLVAIHNSASKIVAANQLYKERLGDKVGQDSRRIFKPGEKGWTAPVPRTFQTGKGQRSKEIVTYRNGKEGPVIVHTAPIRDKSGRVELVVEISADIAEMKRLQEELRSTRQRHRQLFNAVPCYITVQDKQFHLVEANHQFKEHFDFERGAPCHRVYKQRDEPCDDCPVAKTFESGRSHQSEMVVTSRHGEQYNVLIRTAPIRNAAGEVVQVMEMSTNITQIRQLQDHLSSLGLMVSTISHGIKGVLTGLDAGVYFLDSGLENSNQDRIQEGLDIVKHMAERIRSVVMNILYYAKGRELNWERVDVLTLLQETVGIVEPKVSGKNIRIETDFQNDLGGMEADPTLVRAALINILENAVEACLEDASKPEHRIRCAARCEGSHILIDISDDGPGVPLETRDKLFTLFYSSKGHKGTGLGLFIARQVIHQHGGEIRVDSPPGAGARFHVRLPTSLPDSAKTPPPGN